MIRGALAGDGRRGGLGGGRAGASRGWSARRRATRTSRLLGAPLTGDGARWREVGLAAHLVNGAVFGALFAAAGRSRLEAGPRGGAGREPRALAGDGRRRPDPSRPAERDLAALSRTAASSPTRPPCTRSSASCSGSSSATRLSAWRPGSRSRPGARCGTTPTPRSRRRSQRRILDAGRLPGARRTSSPGASCSSRAPSARAARRARLRAREHPRRQLVVAIVVSGKGPGLVRRRPLRSEHAAGRLGPGRRLLPQRDAGPRRRLRAAGPRARARAWRSCSRSATRRSRAIRPPARPRSGARAPTGSRSTSSSSACDDARGDRRGRRRGDVRPRPRLAGARHGARGGAARATRACG